MNFQPLKVATWNVRTLIGDDDGGRGPRRKTALLASELKRYRIDLAALSETRLSGEGSITEGDYTIFWRGYPSGEVRKHGVGLAIKSSHLKKVEEEPNYINERLMTLRVPLTKGEYMFIICVYAPTLMAEEDQIDDFYDSLNSVLGKVDSKDKIILLGDFNARVGSRSDLWEDVIGPHGIGNMNSNGHRLLSLCSQYSLTITNTLFRMKAKFKTSWMHPRSKRWHLLDYIIVRRSQVREVLVTRAMRGAECWTDHRMIMSKMRLMLRPTPSRHLAKRRPKANYAALSNQKMKLAFQEKVKLAIESVGPFTPDNLNEQWNSLADQLMDEARSTLGPSPKKHKDWFEEQDSEIQKLLKEKHLAHQDCLSNPTNPELRRRYAVIRSSVQKRLRSMEDAWWQNMSNEMQRHADNNNTQAFYDCTKRIYGPKKRSIIPVRSADGDTLITDKRGILNRWSEHFSHLLNVHKPSDHTVLDELVSYPPKTELDTPPPLEEVKSMLKELKLRKSPGPDGVPSELLVHGGNHLHTLLHEIISLVWENSTVPTSWKDAVIITLYKNKGDRAQCGNSRGIALLSTAGKLLAKILLKRLVASISEDILPESQCGFRSYRSTSDMIFSARQLLEKSREQRQDLYMAFVDLSKAFDSVDRDLLWKVLRKCGCPARFVGLIRCLHDGMSVRIRIGEDLSEPFVVSRGVKQGCVLAPVLFNIYVQCITRLLAKVLDKSCQITLNYRMDRNLFDSRKLKSKTKVSSTTILELQYADDCALVADSHATLQTVLTHTSEFYQKLGLSINIGKTEFLKYTPAPPANTVNLMIDRLPISEVQHFRYLGSHISADCQLDDEINHRIQQAHCAFGRLRKRVFDNRNIKLQTKVSVYNAAVLSTLLYGSESWTLYRRHHRVMDKFHMTCLRRLLKITWRDKVPNTTVLERTRSRTIETIIHQSQLRWLGHVIRMSDDRLPKQLLYGELSRGTRAVGAPSRRYRDSVLKTLKLCEIKPQDLEALAADRDSWREATRRGLKALELKRLNEMSRRRMKRKMTPQQQPTRNPAENTCTDCGRVCLSPIGLISHRRTHARQTQPTP